MDLELHLLVLLVLHRAVMTNLELLVAQAVAVEVVRDEGPGPPLTRLPVAQAVSSVRDEGSPLALLLRAVADTPGLQLPLPLL